MFLCNVRMHFWQHQPKIFARNSKLCQFMLIFQKILKRPSGLLKINFANMSHIGQIFFAPSPNNVLPLKFLPTTIAKNVPPETQVAVLRIPNLVYNCTH